MRAPFAAVLVVVGSAACTGTAPPERSVGAANYQLSISVGGPGSVRAAGFGDCRTSCRFTATAGTRVGLTAFPDSGGSFSGWGDACSGSGACDVVLDADRNVTATFKGAPPPGKRILSVIRAGNGSIKSAPAGIDCGANCAASFDDGTAVALAAAPDTGWRFTGYGGACSGASCVLMLRSDATVTASFEALPPPDECDGLRPGPIPPAMVFERPADARTGCNAGTADGAGHLAFPSWDRSYDTIVETFDSTGKPLGQANGRTVTLLPQLDGFILEDIRWPEMNARFFAIAPSGVVLAYTDRRAGLFQMAEDPLGGATVVFSETRYQSSRLESYDTRLNLRWSIPLPSGGGRVRAVGTDRMGNTLVIWDHTPIDGPWSLQGVWVDHGGHAGAAFDTGGPAAGNAGYVLSPRVGSGLFLSLNGPRSGDFWARQFDDMATIGKPAPDWLVGRSTKTHMARNGRAYAFIDGTTYGRETECTQHIEIVAPSGKSCGTAEFRIAPGRCVPQSIDVGYDGTVIQQVVAPTCTWRWWTGFLG